jgi:hypothetical protein
MSFTKLVIPDPPHGLWIVSLEDGQILGYLGQEDDHMEVLHIAEEIVRMWNNTETISISPRTASLWGSPSTNVLLLAPEETASKPQIGAVIDGVLLLEEQNGKEITTLESEAEAAPSLSAGSGEERAKEGSSSLEEETIKGDTMAAAKLRVGDCIAWKSDGGVLRTGQYLGTHAARLKSEDASKTDIAAAEGLLRVWGTRNPKSAKSLSKEIKAGNYSYQVVPADKVFKIQ